MEVSQKTFVVSGAGNGIGRETALDLLRRGARVAGVDVREESLRETGELAGAGERFSIHVADLTDRGRVFELPQEIAAEHGTIDGLVHVAGIIQRFVPVRELTIEDIDTVLDVNLWGTIYINKAFLEVLLARPAAALVNVSSMGGFIPFPGQTAYGASKAARKLWTEGLQAELQGTSVAVSVVHPGAIATDITRLSGVCDVTAAGAEADSPIKMTPPAQAGKEIVEAIIKGSPRVRIGKDARLLDRLSRLMPTRAIQIIAKKMAEAAAVGGG